MADGLQLGAQLLHRPLEALQVGRLGRAGAWRSLQASTQAVVLGHGRLELRADLLEDVVELVAELHQPVQDLRRADLLLADQAFQVGGQRGDFVHDGGLLLGLDGVVEALRDHLARVLFHRGLGPLVAAASAREQRLGVLVVVGGPQGSAT